MHGPGAGEKRPDRHCFRRSVGSGRAGMEAPATTRGRRRGRRATPERGRSGAHVPGRPRETSAGRRLQVPNGDKVPGGAGTLCSLLCRAPQHPDRSRPSGLPCTPGHCTEGEMSLDLLSASLQIQRLPPPEWPFRAGEAGHASSFLGSGFPDHTQVTTAGRALRLLSFLWEGKLSPQREQQTRNPTQPSQCWAPEPQAKARDLCLGP